MKRNLRINYAVAGSVALLTVAVYLTAVRNDFVEWDDSMYVVDNIRIRSIDSSFFKWAFLDFYAANWHPLTWISHALDYAVWGLDPLGHHVTNILLHAINTLVVVLLTMRLVESGEPSRERGKPGIVPDTRKPIAAVLTGLLFGLHPLHVESVAWVAERKDLLCAMFFLLGIMRYTKYVVAADREYRGGSPLSGMLRRDYLFTLGLFILALMSKPMAVSFPVVLLILDWFPFDRIRSLVTFRTVFVEKLPFVALSLVSSILTILAQHADWAIVPAETVPLGTRVLVACKALIAYLGKIIVPLQLVPFYPYPKHVSLLSLDYAFPIAAVLGITAACITMARKQKVWSSIWAYYTVTLLPVIGLVQVGNQSMADRYTYLPSLGPFLVIGLGGAWMAEKVNTSTTWRVIGKVAFAGAIAFCVFLSYLTIRQLGVWRSSLDLWDYVIETSSVKTPVVYHLRAVVYEKHGRYQRALEDNDQAISMDPSYAPAYVSRGSVYGKQGRHDKAIEDYNMALMLNPSLFEAYFCRAITYVRTAQFEMAVQDFNRAVGLYQGSHEAYNFRGMALKQLGRFEEAVHDYNRALALNPVYYEAYFNRGIAYEKMRSLDQAVQDYQRAIALNPDYHEAYNNLGILYGQAGEFEKAIELLSKSILLNQGQAIAHLNRGILYAKTGKRSHAAADFRRACDLGNRDGCNALRTSLP
jgi:tetratricopeptide (TPR) repeat protein